MKRWICLLLFCLLIPCAALAADGDLPDVEAFSDGLLKLEPEHEEKLDYKIAKFYRGTDEDVLAVAEAYGALLLDQYSMDEICRFPVEDPEDDIVRVYWAFEYTKNEPSMGSNNIWNDDEGWKIDGYQVLIEYSQSDYYSGEYVMIHYRPEFNYIDTGDRMTTSAKSAAQVIAKPAAESGVECPECGGDGKCDKCGGDMWYWGWEWKYVNGSPESVNVNKMCDAIYCYGGSCDKCGGDGVL